MRQKLQVNREGRKSRDLQLPSSPTVKKIAKIKNPQCKDDILRHCLFSEKKGPAWWPAWTSTSWYTIYYNIIYSKEAPSGIVKWFVL
jgi:hypothetical protein